MTALNDLLRSDASALVASGLPGVESIQYTPAPSGGADAEPVTINAQVFRRGLRQSPIDGSRAVQWDVEIFVSAADVPTVLVRGDRVDLFRHPADTAPTQYLVASLIREDAGGYHLGLTENA